MDSHDTMRYEWSWEALMHPKHVILVTVDTLRADHLSCLGYPRPTTPKIDELAKSGVLFTQAFAHGPNTGASMPSLFTSSYPLMYGGEGYVDGKGLTIAECLKAQGLVTAGLHSNPFLSRAYGHDKGFDFFDDNFSLGVARPLIFLHRIVNYFRYEPYLTGHELNRKAFRWIREHGQPIHRRGGRFFLWLHYMNVHGPYHPPAQYQHLFTRRPVSKLARHKLWKKMIHHGASITEEERRTLVDLYDAEIRCMDDCFAALIQELQALGIYDHSLIVLTADHGEEFGEHAGYFHLKQLYDEVLHVPLILWGPGLPRGEMISQQVRLIDVAPTVFDLLKLTSPSHFLGTSLMPLIEGQGGVNLDLFCEVLGRLNGARTRRFALRTSVYKYIVEFDEDGHLIGRELYHLPTDPRELSNLIDVPPPELAELDRKLKTFINTTGGLEAAVETKDDVDEEVKRRLRDLGYIE